MKKFYFKDDSYWSSQGCSCCEDTMMEVYNSEETDPSLGSAHYRLDCCIQAILTVLIERYNSYDFDTEALYLLKECEVKALCKAMEIEVEIHG